MTAARLDRTDRLLMAAGAAMSLALSVPRLARRPVWLDEAFTIGATQELGRTLRHTGGTMALYYVLVTPVARLSDATFWVRLPSALFAAGSVALVYAIGHHLGGRRLAVVASALLASSWFLSRYAMEARGYALALLLTTMAWLGLVRGVSADRDGDASARRWWVLFAAGTLLAPLAHGVSVLQVPFELLAIALAPGGLRLWRRVVPVLGVLAVEMVALYSIGAGEVANWIPPLNWQQVDTIQRLLLGRDLSRVLVSVAVVVGVALAIRSFVQDRAGDGWRALVPVLWGLGLPLAIIGLSVVRPYAAGRYVLSSLPGISLLVAGVLVRLRRELTVAVCVVLVGALLLDQRYVQRSGLEDWKRLAHRVSVEADDGDLLLMPGQVRAPFDYALRHGQHDPGLVPLSPVDPIGPTKRFYDPAPGSMRERLLDAPAGTVWVVARRLTDLPWFERVLADPAVRRRYRQTGYWTYTGPLYLARLETRADAP